MRLAMGGRKKSGCADSFVLRIALFSGVMGACLLLMNGSISASADSLPTNGQQQKKQSTSSVKRTHGQKPPGNNLWKQFAKTGVSESTVAELQAAPQVPKTAPQERISGDPSPVITEPTASDGKSTNSVSRSQKNKYTPVEPLPKITHWAGVAQHCPVPKAGDWMSETAFLERVLRSFGKQRHDYKGAQQMQGFQDGKIFDDDGMFAFTPAVKSVAIDVGAANNPLSFDLDIDMSQVAFFVEPLQWLTLERSSQADSMALKNRGGCTIRWDGFCTMHRFYVFPAAVSNELGKAQFHATANPYCGSLESFTVEKNNSAIDPALRYSKDPEISGLFRACYQNGGTPGYVPTVSLKAIIERIPQRIKVKYVKIDAQGHDWNVLVSAGDQITRIEYARFEMQVDPLPGRKLVQNIPSYAEVESHMAKLGFKHKKGHACYFEHGTSKFSKAVNEMECVFCRSLPCIENARPPLGENPYALADKNRKLWLKAGKPKRWPPPKENEPKNEGL